MCPWPLHDSWQSLFDAHILNINVTVFVCDLPTGTLSSLSLAVRHWDVKLELRFHLQGPTLPPCPGDCANGLGRARCGCTQQAPTPPTSRTSTSIFYFPPGLSVIFQYDSAYLRSHPERTGEDNGIWKMGFLYSMGLGCWALIGHVCWFSLLQGFPEPCLSKD